MLPDLQQWMANAIMFLIEGDDHDAADVLLSCTVLSGQEYDRAPECEWYEWVASLEFEGPRAAYDILATEGHPVYQKICYAFLAVQATHYCDVSIRISATFASVASDWHAELLEIVRGKSVHNQGVTQSGEKAPRVWKYLRFRSATEVKIADAFDQAGVFFLPNCMGRLNGGDGRRVNREADFLVCHKGHWGVLEVDGKPFHPPSRTAQDHERDRLFRSHGIKTVEHYDGTKCWEKPQEVVKEFLTILARQYAS